MVAMDILVCYLTYRRHVWRTLRPSPYHHTAGHLGDKYSVEVKSLFVSRFEERLKQARLWDRINACYYACLPIWECMERYAEYVEREAERWWQCAMEGARLRAEEIAERVVEGMLPQKLTTQEAKRRAKALYIERLLAARRREKQPAFDDWRTRMLAPLGQMEQEIDGVIEKFIPKKIGESIKRSAKIPDKLVGEAFIPVRRFLAAAERYLFLRKQVLDGLADMLAALDTKKAQKIIMTASRAPLSIDQLTALSTRPGELFKLLTNC